jgi:hypothetical protein
MTGVSATPACCDDEAVRIARTETSDAASYCNNSGTIAIIIREINDDTRKPCASSDNHVQRPRFTEHF